MGGERRVKFLLYLLISLPICGFLVYVAMNNAGAPGYERDFGALEIVLTLVASVAIAYTSSTDKKVKKTPPKDFKELRGRWNLRAKRQARFMVVLFGLLTVGMGILTVTDWLLNIDSVGDTGTYGWLTIFSIVMTIVSIILWNLMEKRK